MNISVNLKKIIICLVYMIIGPTLIMLNKYILYDLKFPYPIFLSGLGVLCSGLFAQLIVRFNKNVLTSHLNNKTNDMLTGWSWYQRIMPIGLTYALTLALGNYVYLFLNVGLIQMLKSFVPVIIMFFSYIFGFETPSYSIIISVIIIVIGVSGTVSYTPQLTVIGLLITFFAECCEAIRLVLTQFLLQNMRFSIIEGQYYLSPISAFFLFLASILLEFSEMYSKNAFSIIIDNLFIFICASCLGLVINYLTYVVIQETSSLTLKILGSVRNIGTIVVSVLQYNEVITLQTMRYYTIACIGFILYTLAKSGYIDESYWLGVSSHNHNNNSGSSSGSSSSGGNESSKLHSSLPSYVLLPVPYSTKARDSDKTTPGAVSLHALEKHDTDPATGSPLSSHTHGHMVTSANRRTAPADGTALVHTARETLIFKDEYTDGGSLESLIEYSRTPYNARGNSSSTNTNSNTSINSYTLSSSSGSISGISGSGSGSGINLRSSASKSWAV